MSDFEVGDTISDDAPPAQLPGDAPREIPEESPEPIPRLYANQRGRKAAARAAQDLVAAFAAGNDLLGFLRKNELVEEWPVSC